MRKYSNNKEIHHEVCILEKTGWIYRSGKKHGVMISPNGLRLVIPGTPSDHRAVHNFKRDIKHIMKKESADVQ
ncbi:hypothetical protein [Candidatus Venteria ishoeyi]|uniref:hypothetical protein n=1 Tax=Candidatus Venteria ishoeyi TaxID=1899563 RepID=UPI000CDE9449|nr:hypothetical protein [Candidatus Venteria ishoeyi]